jgi:superfamily II RNA helicase
MLHAVQDQPGRPMSIRAFAEAAETSPRRIRRLIRQGRLRTIENQAGEVRVPETELERLMSWKGRRSLRHSMEVAAVSMEMEPSRGNLRAVKDDPIQETYAMQVPLSRHEAAMMRVGYLESELAVCHRLLQEGKEREIQLKDDYNEQKERTELAETRLEEIQDKLVETEFKLEEMRAQVIESSFQAVHLQEEVKALRERLMSSWWSRFLEAWRQSGKVESSTSAK